MAPDPAPEPRIRDPELLTRLHLEWKECALAERLDVEHEPVWRRSLHHIHRHPRDDVRENLVMLCGDGTTGCHGRIEHHDEDTCYALGRYLRISRPDFFLYLSRKLERQGGATAADAWLRRFLA